MTIPFTIDVDDVCTHEQLVEELGVGADVLAEDTATVRTLALRDVLKALGRRSPPIYASDISEPAELREAVIYGALERVFRDAMTAEGDVYAMKRKLYERRFFDEVSGLKLTTSGGPIAVAGFTVGRR